MINHTVEDGLKLLTYLGLEGLTVREIEVFREKWEEMYREYSGDLIMATFVLYSRTLPGYAVPDTDSGAKVAYGLYMVRDINFRDKLKETGLLEKIVKGISLKDIFAASPQRFAETN